MGVTFKKRGNAVSKRGGTPAAINGARVNCGHSKPLPVTALRLDQPGRLRVGHLLTLFAVSHTTIYQRVREGKLPRPDGNDGRPFWKTATIRTVLEE